MRYVYTGTEWKPVGQETRTIKQDGKFVEVKNAPTCGKYKRPVQEGKDQGRKLTDGKLYVAHNRQKWRGFNLIRGHVYGMIQGELYVSGAEADSARPGYIMVYKQVSNRNLYRWIKLSVSAKSNIGSIVMEAIRNSPYKGVEFPDYKTDCTGSKARFPTFKSKRPDAKPPLPRVPQMETWVDRICASAAV